MCTFRCKYKLRMIIRQAMQLLGYPGLSLMVGLSSANRTISIG